MYWPVPIRPFPAPGKTFETWPEMVDNVIPFIGGEEEKSEKEPMKIWGSLEGDEIKLASSPSITTQCIRVPVSDGHLAAVFVRFDQKPSKEEILRGGVSLPESHSA